ncbi:hypothetical protein [Corynebacterium pseudodiphtheriticum]|uniref:hypothetical protein n=1 Tax=Corynebacterium pseudodiphtheriticum TaxID=37637 RepID=UPI00254D58B8|nr:hypothetical protein [Corynebacterium pseudodiphtheriticum]
MGLAAEAEKRRYFGSEILTHSNITAAQEGSKKNSMCMKPEYCPLKKKDDLSTISHSWRAGWWRVMSISGLFRRLRRS